MVLSEFSVQALKAARTVLACLLFLGAASSGWAKLDIEKLAPEEIALVDSILKKKAAMIQAKNEAGTLPLLKFDELYDGLEKKEKKFLKALMKIQPEDLDVKTPFQGMSPKHPELEKLEPQILKLKDKTKIIAPQYLPKDTLKACQKMMAAMEKSIAKKLLIGSAFRSSAYQLYSFVFYLRQHGYSLKETAALNALPGYSEHGTPEKLALDFVNEDGIDDDSPAELFEKLPEYKWLRRNAYRFGFFMSYPKKNAAGISFEPWHWRYDG